MFRLVFRVTFPDHTHSREVAVVEAIERKIHRSFKVVTLVGDTLKVESDSKGIGPKTIEKLEIGIAVALKKAI